MVMVNIVIIVPVMIHEYRHLAYLLFSFHFAVGINVLDIFCL